MFTPTERSLLGQLWTNPVKYYKHMMNLNFMQHLKAIRSRGGRVSIKMSSYQHRDPRVKDKAVSRRYPHIWERRSLCWDVSQASMISTKIWSSQAEFSLINLFPSSTAYMRRWTGSASVQIMACRLDGTIPLSKPMLTYCLIEPKFYISMKFYSN